MKSIDAALGALVLGAMVPFFGTGCSHQAEREPEMVPAASTVVANDRAIEKMANANCDREAACKNIGLGRRYETRNLCLGTFEREKYELLGFGECLLGVDHSQLELCVRQIEGERCASPLADLETLVACRASELCRD